MDKRRYERFLRDLKVSYTVLSKVDSTPFEFGNSVTRDISRTGLALQVDEPIPVPILLQLQICVPSRPYGLFVLGKSVYCSPEEEHGMYRVGIKFVGMLPPDLEHVLEEVRGEKNRSSGT